LSRGVFFALLLKQGQQAFHVAQLLSQCRGRNAHMRVDANQLEKARQPVGSNMALHAKTVQNRNHQELKPSFACFSRPQGRLWMLIALGLCFLMSMNATFRSIDQDGYLPKTLLATTDQFGDNQTARCTDFLCFFVFLVINS
jgi:hypothetical protein